MKRQPDDRKSLLASNWLTACWFFLFSSQWKRLKTQCEVRPAGYHFYLASSEVFPLLTTIAENFMTVADTLSGRRNKSSWIGCAVRFRLKRKLSETKVQFFSLRSETEGIVLLRCETADFRCETKWKQSKKKHRKRSKPKRNKAKQSGTT